MKIVTAAQMRSIDAATISERGVPGWALMDRAGKAVAREALERFEPESVAIVTGKGNNAGDGFVAARELARHGVRAVLYMLCPADALSGDALEAYEKLPPDLERIIDPSPGILREQLIHYDLTIDAIVGTGLRGPLEGRLAEAVEAINACRMNVLAVDIPSGLPGDVDHETKPFEPHIRAVVTVTMGLPKIAMTMDPGVRSTGRVVVADLGFPPDLLEDHAIHTNLMAMNEMRDCLPARPPDGHKGTFGKALILGGCRGMTGAAVLAARAAAHSGAGLIYACYPAALEAIFEANLIEQVKMPLEGGETFFTGAQAERVVEEARHMQAVAVGPGLGKHEATRAFLDAIVRRVAAPLVVDADGLNLLAENIDALDERKKTRQAATVLTPHPLEAARLLGCSTDEVMANRLEAFKDFSARHNAVVVLKGAQTVITSPDGQRYLNPTGNSGLAKGGSGDVLTGLICGLIAQGAAPLDAACLGVFLHGMAADIAAETESVRAITPATIIENFGRAFKRLEQCP